MQSHDQQSCFQTGHRLENWAVIRPVFKKNLFQLIQTPLSRNQIIPAALFHCFNRILIQDSTTIKLPRGLTAVYPGSINQTGKQAATLRIQACIDIKTSSFKYFDLTPYTRNDQAAAADILPIVEKGDLIIRDRGYYVLTAFKQIQEKGASFVSRLRYPTILFDNNTGKPISLFKKLKKHGNLDIPVRIGNTEKIPGRLIAIKLNPKEARRRIAQLKNHPDRRRNPSKEHLALCAWAIFITDVSSQSLSPENIAKIYAIRWYIEILFKAWKSYCHFEEIPSFATKSMVEASIYAKLIYIVLFFEKLLNPTMRLFNHKWKKQISLLKYLHFINSFAGLIQYGHRKIIPNQYWNTLILRFCTYENRTNRKNYPQQLLDIACINPNQGTLT